MLADKLKSKYLILASQSPRRSELLAAMNLDFEVIVKPIDERFPLGLTPTQVAEHIAFAKAQPFKNTIKLDQIIITGDTIVAVDDQILGKPKDRAEAITMINLLSGRSHEVVSSICLLTPTETIVKSDLAKVYFNKLSQKEIEFYVDTYKPFDKAGAYGIQEWLGHIGIERLEGSYNTVMGLPTQLLYGMLEELVEG